MRLEHVAEGNEANVPDVCVHVLDRSEFCFVPGSLKVLYLRNIYFTV